MDRWLATLLLLTACMGSQPEPVVLPTPGIPDAPPTERRAAPDADLPVSTARKPVPEGLLEVRFDGGGLRVLPPGGEPVLVAPADGGKPATMPEAGLTVPALEAWAGAQLPTTREPREVAVAVPGSARYAVLKAILRALHARANARTAWLIVQDDSGAERAIRLDFPDLHSPGKGPVTLQVLMDRKGLTLQGLRDTYVHDRYSKECSGPCAGRESYDLPEIGRLGYRLHARHGADHVLIIPHNDVPVEVVVGALDWSRDDTLTNARGELVYPNAALAGSRPIPPTDEEIMQSLKARTEARLKAAAAGDEQDDEPTPDTD